MLRIITSILVFLIISCTEKNQEVPIKQPIAIVHGGAEPYSKKHVCEKKKINQIRRSLTCGISSFTNRYKLDAVEQTIILEDHPYLMPVKELFSRMMKIELDASIMEGAFKSRSVAG